MMTAEQKNEACDALLEDDPLAAKRAAAIAYLGKNHVMHPEYQFNPRHSFSVAGWQPNSVLRPIQLAAQQAGRI